MHIAKWWHYLSLWCQEAGTPDGIRRLEGDSGQGTQLQGEEREGSRGAAPHNPHRALQGAEDNHPVRLAAAGPADGRGGDLSGGRATVFEGRRHFSSASRPRDHAGDICLRSQNGSGSGHACCCGPCSLKGFSLSRDTLRPVITRTWIWVSRRRLASRHWDVSSFSDLFLLCSGNNPPCPYHGVNVTWALTDSHKIFDLLSGIEKEWGWLGELISKYTSSFLLKLNTVAT